MLREILFLLAQSTTGSEQPEPQQAQGGDFLSILPLFIILFIIMYVFMILPQRRREKQRKAMLSALKKNDHVLTIGGIHGIITNIKDDRITIRIDDNKDVKLTVTSSSIASITSKEEKEDNTADNK
ncbi:MAG: preprotein translocase subunit YajC [Planctomycetota bacterium]